VKMGSDGRYRKEVAHEIARRGLQDHVFLLGLRSDAAALMRCAEIVILPTHSEGFPRAVWEAQVLARPVVSTPMGGVTDLIEDGRTGLLVPMDDGPALAGAITRLCEDPALRARIVKNAADQIGLRFSEAAQHETLCSALGSTRQEVFHASR